MGFAQPDTTHNDHVGALFNELQAEQILYLQAIDFARPGPVELLKTLAYREAGKA